METSSSLRRRVYAAVGLALSVGLLAACDGGPVAVESPSVEPSLAKGGGAGRNRDSEIHHATAVTFADRPGDTWMSDGGGAYSPSSRTFSYFSDLVDPAEPDFFWFAQDKERGRWTQLLLDVPGFLPASCTQLKSIAFAPTGTADWYNTAPGWSGVLSRHWVECSPSSTFLPRVRVDVFDCAGVAHVSTGQWVVTVDACPAVVSEVIDRGGRTVPIDGDFVVSYELTIDELE